MIRRNLARSTSRLAATPILIAGLVLGGTIGLLVAAGPLDPPAGPVTGTYKTLSEVEPRTAITVANTPPSGTAMFRITQPGSYYLTGNITATANKGGIEISTSGDVSIDLAGFSITGDGVSGVNGITGGGVGKRIISNGTVRSFGNHGMLISGAGSVVSNVTVMNNDGTGLTMGVSSVVRDCVAASNTGVGIVVGTGCSVIDCLSNSNTGGGITASAGCTLTGCTARANGADGFAAVGSGTTVTACTSEINAGDGFSGSTAWQFVNCNSAFNSGAGINTGNGVISHCTIHANVTDGIRVTGGCTIIENQCASSSSGAGIHATGSDNRIEGNNIALCLRGIQLEAAGNFVARNTCTGNGTNWVIAIGNSIGSIVVAGTNAIAINTNGAVLGTLGSADPNANYSY